MARDATIPHHMATDDMAAVPAGTWQVGCEGPEAYPDDNEGPVREVTLPPFLIDRKAVSNAAFARIHRGRPDM